jgi:transposase
LLSVVAPLLAVMRPLNQQLAYSDEAIEHLAVHDPCVPRLRSVPCVGPVTAAAFLAAVNDAQRFRHAHQLEAYLGLVPREHSSGDTQRRGPITQGGPLARTLAARSRRDLDPAPPAPRGRGALDLGPAHRRAPGHARRRRRARPPPGRHPLCAPPPGDFS